MTEMEESRELWIITTLDSLGRLALDEKLAPDEVIKKCKAFLATTGEVIICGDIEIVAEVKPVSEVEGSTPPEPSSVPDTEEMLNTVLNTMFRFEEGYELTEYLDSKGIPTIGIGHRITNLDRQAFSNANGKLVIAAEQAEALFKRDVSFAVEAAKKWLGAYWNGLSVNRQAVCVGMAFQMGVNSLADFSPTREHIIRGEWADVNTHFLSTKWYRDTPKRVVRMGQIMITNLLPGIYFKKGQ